MIYSTLLKLRLARVPFSPCKTCTVCRERRELSQGMCMGFQGSYLCGVPQPLSSVPLLNLLGPFLLLHTISQSQFAVSWIPYWLQLIRCCPSSAIHRNMNPLTLYYKFTTSLSVVIASGFHLAEQISRNQERVENVPQVQLRRLRAVILNPFTECMHLLQKCI